jgi:hypothetical protein
VLRVYHLQREEFLPSAYATILAFVTLVLVLITPAARLAPDA